MNRFKIAVVVLLTAGVGTYARAQPPDATGAGQYTAFVDTVAAEYRSSATPTIDAPARGWSFHPRLDGFAEHRT
jgi:hypothetical protein